MVPQKHRNHAVIMRVLHVCVYIYEGYKAKTIKVQFCTFFR
jgi:hypothetical protein